MSTRQKKEALVILLAIVLIFLSPYAKASWTTKRLTWNAGWSGDPAIAIDSSNNIHVVWHDDTPGNWEIYYKRGK